MHALLLSLALGQAVPPALEATAADPDATATPAPTLTQATIPTQTPTPALTSTPSSNPPPPRLTGDARTPRAVEVTRLPNGAFSATLDGQPVAGADFYRAVLRPDLAARTEEAQGRRTALFIAAGMAPLAGLGIGWVWATAQERPIPPCLAAPIPVTLGGTGVNQCDLMREQNQATMRSGLLAGGLSGLVAGVRLLVWGNSVEVPLPTADEAEAMVRAYRARAAPVPDPTPLGDRGGASLELEAAPGAARLALRLRF